MRVIYGLIIACGLLVIPTAFAHGPGPVSLQNVPIPPVPGLLDGADPIVVNQPMAIALGKALFWDVNVGSDGQACASCHFSAGADLRTKNQLNPGQNSSLPSGQTFDVLKSGTGGPNHTLSLADFPLHEFTDITDNTSPVSFTTDDVVGSAGAFGGQFKGASQFTGANDQCVRSADPVFNVNHVGTRRVEARNAPTVINAVFNHRNFWDGRANNIFNGSSPWGERDPNAGVWIKQSARSVVKQPLKLINSSLASQAVAPPIFNDIEMGCESRIWPDIGRKLLLRQPLQNQQVHNQDSVLGLFSLSSNGNLRPGLNTIYKNMITQAFNSKYWAFSGVGPFGAPVTGGAPYSQMEANFSLFFGLAIQLYESTLISDQSPFDLSPVSNVAGLWTPSYSNVADTTTRNNYVNGFNQFFTGHCSLCHAGPNLSLAAVATNAALQQANGNTFGPAVSPIPFGINAFGSGERSAVHLGVTAYANPVNRDDNYQGNPVLMDMGFFNTGVANPESDPGVAGVDPFGNPLSFSSQYVNYLIGNTAGLFDPGMNTIRACDFSSPIAFNDLLIPGYFSGHDGIIADGSREGALRNQNCLRADSAYIPSIAAAQANLSGPKMASDVQSAFKIPTLRNVELTGPYMHNGGMATLKQVLEFYSRQGNFPTDNLSFNILQIQSTVNATDSPNIIDFLNSLTDDRVRYQQAPFDHPQIIIPNGQVGNDQQLTAGNPLGVNLGLDQHLVIPAVGASGSATPLSTFLSTSP